jgi:hypothetical protein
MSILASKRQLVEAIELYDHLKTELSNKDAINTYSEEEWQKRLRNLGLEAVSLSNVFLNNVIKILLIQAQLIQISRTFDNENLLQLLKKKQAKLVRHSAWKKRHKKRVQQRKMLISKRSEKWIRDIEWKVAISPSVVAAHIAQQKSSSVEKRANDQLKSKIRELSKQLSKLTKLRDLRRKKLEAKGHFFADDGNQFFNQVKAWYESNTAFQEEKEEEKEEETESPKKGLTIHKDDAWQHIDIDQTAYKYWCEADQSLDALLKVRRLWDQYILLEERTDNRLHKVPPTFVTPAPPANSIWASYLL